MTRTTSVLGEFLPRTRPSAALVEWAYAAYAGKQLPVLSVEEQSELDDYAAQARHAFRHLPPEPNKAIRDTAFVVFWHSQPPWRRITGMVKR